MVKCRTSAWCMLVNIIILLALTKDIAETHEIKHPAPEFSRHSIVRPTVHHARTKREITTTRDTNGIHHREVTVTVDVDDEKHVLDLRLNEDLVTGDHTVSYVENGKRILHKPNREELDICQYSGTVRGKKGSWVAVSTCRGVRGVINDGARMLYIEPAHGNIDSKHFVYSHADLNTEFSCGVPDVTNNTNFDPELLKEHLDKEKIARSRIGRHKRDTSDDTVVRGPFNTNKLSRYVELVLVADHREYIASGKSRETVHHTLKDLANIVNSIYAPLNIFIALVGVVVWTEKDEIVLEKDPYKILPRFRNYRRTRLLQDIPNDNAQLLTRQKFNGSTVGLAGVGVMCSPKDSAGLVRLYSKVLGVVASTMAHEMGHNFGLHHDNSSKSDWPNNVCVMNDVNTPKGQRCWSSGSIQTLAQSFKDGLDYCLRNKPQRLFMSPTCGDGFVEPGEQCDCGLDGSPDCSACCDPSTCLLRSNATCAVGECCDPQTCRLRSAGTVCRPADTECDLPEFCTGDSEFCPNDVFKMDTTPCSNNQMCLNERCVPVQKVVERISRKEGSVCPSNCSGHGVCNSEGHCHCEQGFAPPLCAGPGLGGSYDSGPATDSSVHRRFMVAMYVIFLGILPSILLVLFLLYYTKHNVPTWWKKPRKTVQSTKKNSLQRHLSRRASKLAANLQTIHGYDAVAKRKIYGAIYFPKNFSSALSLRVTEGQVEDDVVEDSTVSVWIDLNDACDFQTPIYGSDAQILDYMAPGIMMTRIVCAIEDCHVKKLNKIFKACEDRVTSKSYTAETCAQEVTDLMQALDHCVGDDLFKRLV